MSLVGQALAITVRNMLLGRTWAEDRVLEQPVDPMVEVLRTGDQSGKPWIAVYTEQTKGDPEGNATQSRDREVTVKVIAYMPPQLRVVEQGIELKFDNSGAGLALNIIGRQIGAAFHTGNDPWVKLYRKLAYKTDQILTRFLLIEIENGVRVPSIEITFRIKAIPEPEFAKPLYGYWLELDGLLRATSEGALVADIFKALIEMQELPDFAQFQINTNLTDAAFTATGLAPIILGNDGLPVILETVNSSPDIEVVAPNVP